MYPSQHTWDPLQCELLTVPPPLLHAFSLFTQVEPCALQSGVPGLGASTRRGSQTQLPADGLSAGRRQSSCGVAHGFELVRHETSSRAGSSIPRPAAHVAMLDVEVDPLSVHSCTR